MKNLIGLGLLIASLSTAHADDKLLQKAIGGSHRSQEHVSRDQYRHPNETLSFFGVEPDMTVVEIWPGGKGWYTEILAPYLKDNGKLVAAHFSSQSDIPYFTKNLAKFILKTASQEDVYGKMTLMTLQPPQFLNIKPKGGADRVLTFRNVHNWMKNNQADAVFKAMYDALKPGGILGVVEHRAIAKSKQDPQALSGYVTEATVIALAKNAGFVLDAKSEINANSKDTTDHPKGVWTLPPSLKLKEKDREKYIAIGESDRMTLKFIKP